LNHFKIIKRLRKKKRKRYQSRTLDIIQEELKGYPTLEYDNKISLAGFEYTFATTLSIAVLTFSEINC